jgi:hypothetical protein
MDKIELFEIIDEELGELESISLRGTVHYQSILSAMTALKDLKRRVEERLEPSE